MARKAVLVKTGIRTFRESKAAVQVGSWLRVAWQARYFRYFLLGWLIASFLPLIYAVIFLPNLPDQIPLFYSRPWGGQQLANRLYILLPIVGNFLLGIFNFSVAIINFEKDRILTYLLVGSATLTAILIAITTINIVNLIR